MVATVGNVPSLWKSDLCVTARHFPRINHLWWKYKTPPVETTSNTLISILSSFPITGSGTCTEPCSAKVHWLQDLTWILFGPNSRLVWEEWHVAQLHCGFSAKIQIRDLQNEEVASVQPLWPSSLPTHHALKRTLSILCQSL